MKKHRFKLISSDGTPVLADMERDTYPLVGESLAIFNFPVIERYVIERLEPRADYWAHDWFERMALVIRKDKILQAAAASDNVIAFNPDGHLVTRLAKIEKIARSAIDDQLTLEMAHADFEVLCTWGGLSGDVCDYDVLAYRDIPMKVGEAGESWNASTAFHGFSNDSHVLYVTLPGGVPFVMNPTMLETAKAFFERRLTAEQALVLVVAASVGSGAEENGALVNGLREIFNLIAEGIMPIYDAAQEMTRMAARIDRQQRRERAVLH